MFLFLFAACKSWRGPVTDENNEPEVAPKDSFLITGWYSIANYDNGYMRQTENDTAHYFIEPMPIVSAKHFVSLHVAKDLNDIPILTMQFDTWGTAVWSEATKQAVGNRLGFILNNKLITTPTVNEQIPHGRSAIASREFSENDLHKIKAEIEKEMRQ